MTIRREVPFSSDTLAWVHNELADIKARLGLVQQAAEQSKLLATDASDKALQARAKVDQLDGQPMAMLHFQDELHVMREQLVRVQDDIHSLRQSREETERKLVAESEHVRADRNELVRHFGDLERMIEISTERLGGVEEHSRRHLEGVAQLAMRLETLEAAHAELDTLYSRSQTTVSRIDQDVQQLQGVLGELEREDDMQRERVGSAVEMLSRLGSEIEGVKTQTNRISRIDDRLELVQAERTRHNERLNEITQDLDKIDDRLNLQSERTTLIEVRIGGYQEELRGLNERIQMDREQIAAYLHSLAELEADMRKRQIIALEKEIRDVRGRAINFTDE